MTRWLNNIKTLIGNLLKILVITVFATLTFYLSLYKVDTGAVIFAIFTIFFVLFFYGNKFEIVEVLGAKFKLKELNSSINELKELSKTIASISLDLLQRNGRWGSSSTEIQKKQFFEQINNILDNVHISKEEKDKIYNLYWHNWVIWDYSVIVYTDIHNAINASNINNEYKESLMSLCTNPKNYQNIINAYDEARANGVNFNKELQEKVEDFKYYYTNKKHKDVNRWLEYNSKEQ